MAKKKPPLTEQEIARVEPFTRWLGDLRRRHPKLPRKYSKTFLVGLASDFIYETKANEEPDTLVGLVRRFWAKKAALTRRRRPNQGAQKEFQY